MNIVSAVDMVLLLWGLLLILFAKQLSIRYNAWTTRVRERHPNFNPPPTPEWRTRNTKIMTFVFRIVGVIVVIRSALMLLGRTGS